MEMIAVDDGEAGTRLIGLGPGSGEQEHDGQAKTFHENLLM